MGDWGKDRYSSPYSIKNIKKCSAEKIKEEQMLRIKEAVEQGADISLSPAKSQRYAFRNGKAGTEDFISKGPAQQSHSEQWRPDGHSISNLDNLHTDELMKYYQEILHKGKRDLIDHQRKSTTIKKINPQIY